MIKKYDRKTQQSTEILNQDSDIDFIRLVYMNDDDLYGVTMNNQGQYQLVQYHSKDKQTETIFKTNNFQAINNCQIYLDDN